MEINKKSKLRCFICDSKQNVKSSRSTVEMCHKFQIYTTKFFNSLPVEENKSKSLENEPFGNGGDANQTRNKMNSCCAKCALEVGTFCEMWETLESLQAEMNQAMVTISNLVKFESIKQSPKVCFICLAVSNSMESLTEKFSQTETCLNFITFVTRFVLNTKNSCFAKKFSQIFAEMGKTRNECVYCCDICLTEIITFCEMYEALDSLRLEILRIFDRISNRSKHFKSSAETCRKRSFPRINLERLASPDRQHDHDHIQLEPENTSEFRIADTKPGPKYHNRRKKYSHSFGYKGFCVFCKIEFTKPCQMELHLQRHICEKYCICRICLLEYSKRETLLNHQQNSHKKNAPKPHKCNICGKAFAQREWLQVHRNVHVDKSGRPYGCKFCEKTFASQYDVKIHKRDVHNGIKRNRRKSSPDSCDICRKTFSSKGTLNRHKRVAHDVIQKKKHRSRLNTICDICGKKFKWLAHLKRHKLSIHEGIKVQTTYRPMSCDICGKAFGLPHHLKRHQLGVHEGIKQTRKVARTHICDICGKAFPGQANLIRHKTSCSKRHRQ